MVVIDDPQSILRCTNKVFLAELLKAKRVPTPRTVIAGKPDLMAAEEAIGYPMVDVALKAANLIGDGLYGVDLKQRGDEVFVIEINDNPNIESGVEDAYLKDELYRTVINEFVRRLELRHRQRA